MKKELRKNFYEKDEIFWTTFLEFCSAWKIVGRILRNFE